MKRRKPDLMVVLAVILGLSILATGLTQALSQQYNGSIQLSRQ